MAVHGLQQLDALISKFKNFESQLTLKIVEVINREKERIVQINRDYLAKRGERPDGQPIQARGYSYWYAEYKRQYATYKNTEFVDLKFSGRFQASFDLEYVRGLEWRFTATDEKAAELMARYGQLLGLSNEDADDFLRTVIIPEIRLFTLQYFKG